MTAPSAPLNVDRLASAANGNRLIGRKLVVRAETQSTNDLCLSVADESTRAEEGLVVFAEHQVAGRGQQGSVWSAPPRSSLLFSILLYPPLELARPHFLVAWSAVAVAERLASALSLDPRIKWPNDLLLGGRKVAGILVERGKGTVVGIGLNVSIERERFPPNLRLPATSLAAELGHAVDRTELALGILESLDHGYDRALAQGPGWLWERWRALAEPLESAPVVASTRRGSVTGTLSLLRPDIGARVIGADGSIVAIPPEDLVRLERAPPPRQSD